MKRIDYKWTALALLWVACFLQQGMRQIFPPLASTIGDSFGASATFRGSVMSVFTLVYALAVPFSGIAGDFLSRKKIVAFSLFVFSMGVFGAGWAASILGIMLLYGAVNGFGQSFFYPAATSLVQQLHSDNKATALSILQLALYSGIILFSFASGKMLDVCGSWQVPFRAFGFAGIVWAIALLFLLRDTKPVASGGDKPSFSEALKAVFSKPSAMLLAAGLGLQIFVDVGFKMWMPTYLQETFSVQMPQMGKADWGLHAVLWHYLGAFVGVMIGSRISDRLVRGRPGIRMEMNIIGLILGAPFIWWMAKADTFVAICVAMGLFGLFRGVYDSNQFASIFDVVAPRYRASAMGIILCFAFVFGAIAPMVLGWMKDNFSMSAGLAGLSVFFVVAALIILLARLVFLKRDYVKPMIALALVLVGGVLSARAENLDVEFVKGLIAIPSESRSIPECNRATAYLRGYLEKRGVFCHVERTGEGRDALYASTVPGPTCEYGFVTHIDVVPAQSPSQFQPKLVGDELWGRGSCDTKVNAALIAQLLINLKGKASVGAFFATDEDGCCGKVPTCTMLRRAGYAPTKMILVGDTTGDITNRLLTAQKGHWGFKLTARGHGGHSSVPWRLDNAIPKITAATEKIVAAYPKPLTDAFANTLSPTILTAGDAPNAIPGEASVTFSFRYVGKHDVEKLRLHIVELTGLEPETLYCVPPVANDPNDPLIQDLIAAMKRRWPDASLGVEDGATDAFQFSDLNLPTVIYGPDAHGAHQPDEHGSLKSAADYLDFFTKWLEIKR